MGHYCKICERTRANEKFSGKGHKNYICKDCSGKSGRKMKKDSVNENILALEALIPSNAASIQSESTYYNDNRICETDFENENTNNEKDEELPF
jgi:hypothetical protein